MADAVTYTALRNTLARKQYSNVYFIHGEEGYYIDELAGLFETILPESERDFNQYTLYAPQTDAATVAEACQRYPMMAERQVVIVKEAQAVPVAWFNKLLPYLESPVATTLLVIIARGASVKSATLTKSLAKGRAVVFESKRLAPAAVTNTIREFIKERGLTIDDKALAMLQDYVGSDLSRIYNEIGKMTVALPANAMITPESVERNIGVSKDYNNFELIAAIARRDVPRIYKIINYFRRDPKNHQPIVTTPLLFNFFANLLTALYAPDKSDRGLMAELGFKWPGQLTDIKPGLANYRPWQIIKNISAIRQFDAQSKGIGSRADQFDLFEILIFQLLNNPNRP
ncbi:MAG: DNA polymerase III subunit delta [Bacteroidales bacterium 52_46]|nr:MAG: DNA polymerase III subunit delta [Bacteroidales bacterium 52_46]